MKTPQEIIRQEDFNPEKTLTILVTLAASPGASKDFTEGIEDGIAHLLSEFPNLSRPTYEDACEQLGNVDYREGVEAIAFPQRRWVFVSEPEDIPLENAVIGWTPQRLTKKGFPANVVVIPWQEEGTTEKLKTLGVPFAAGAYMDEWLGFTDKERISILYYWMWNAVIFDGVMPSDIHVAFCCIPEYRNSLRDNGEFARMVQL